MAGALDLGYCAAMDRRLLYEEDYFAWLQQQAAALRRLAEERRDLPNDLDIVQIAEEIEDVGKSELRAAENFITNILVHLLLLAFDPHTPARDGWRTEILTFHRTLLKFASPSMRQLIDLDTLWDDARAEAEARLRIYGRPLPRSAREGCPLTFETLTAKNVDWDAAVLRLMNEAAP